MDTRLMLRSIALAVGLTLGLGVVFAIAILLVNQAGTDDNNSSSTQNDKSCLFTGANAILTVYQAPVTDATQEKARVSGSEQYSVSQRRDKHLLIELRDGRTAWADQRDGSLKGNCKNVPVDDTPLTAFPTLCTFTNTTNVSLYSSSTLTGVIGTVAPGTYPLIGFNQSQYYLYLDADQGGWVLGSTGFIQGNCVMLPARPG